MSVLKTSFIWKLSALKTTHQAHATGRMIGLVNEATHIQTTAIDNQQHFMHIHSTGLTATLLPCCAVLDPRQEVQQTDPSDGLLSLSSFIWLVVVFLVLMLHHTLVLSLVASRCSFYVLFHRVWKSCTAPLWHTGVALQYVQQSAPWLSQWLEPKTSALK